MVRYSRINHETPHCIAIRVVSLRREVGAEPHRLLGVRVSPSGFHVLLRFHDSITELWAVRERVHV
jgi:hypothetical protein